MLISDLIINCIGVAGIFLYICMLVRQWSCTYQELSLVLFLSVVSILLICQGISWIYDSKLIIILAAALVSLLPLVYLIYCESLLSRHSPLWLKLLTVGASLTFFIWFSVSNTVHNEPVIFSIFILFLFFHQIVLSIFLLLRDHKDLNSIENNLADVLPAIVGVMSLFFMTDFKPVSTLLHQQIGGIGALIFIYSLVRLQEQPQSKWLIGKEAFGIVCLSMFVAALYCSVLHVRDQYLYIQLTSLTFSIILFGMISNRLIFFSSRSNGLSFMKRLVEIPFESKEQLLKTVCFTGANVDFIIIKGEQLDGYDCENISTYFSQNNGKPVKIRDVRKVVYRHGKIPNSVIDLFTKQHVDVAEQLRSILEINEMTHAYALSFHPLQLLLVRIPQIRKWEIIELEIMLLLKVYAYVPRPQRERGDIVHLSTVSNDFSYP